MRLYLDDGVITVTGYFIIIVIISLFTVDVKNKVKKLK